MSKFIVNFFQKHQWIWKIYLKTENYTYFKELWKTTYNSKIKFGQNLIFGHNSFKSCQNLSQPCRALHTTIVKRKQKCVLPSCPEPKIPCPCFEDRTPPIPDFRKPRMLRPLEPCEYLNPPIEKKKCTLICPTNTSGFTEWEKYHKCKRMCLSTCKPRGRTTIHCHVPLTTAPVKERILPPLPAYSECRCYGKPITRYCPECKFRRKVEYARCQRPAGSITCIPLRHPKPVKCHPRVKPQQKPWSALERCQIIVEDPCDKIVRMDEVVAPKIWKPLPSVLPPSTFTRPRIDKHFDLDTYIRYGRRFSTFAPRMVSLEIFSLLGSQKGFGSLMAIRQFTTDNCLNKQPKYPTARKLNASLAAIYSEILKESEANKKPNKLETSTVAENNLEQTNEGKDIDSKVGNQNRFKVNLNSPQNTRNYSTIASGDLRKLELLSKVHRISNELKIKLPKQKFHAYRPRDCVPSPKYKIQCHVPVISPPFHAPSTECTPEKCPRKLGWMSKGICNKINVCPGPSKSRVYCAVADVKIRCKRMECPYECFTEMKRYQFADRSKTECEIQDYKRHQTLMRLSRLPELTELNGKLYNLCR